ncbi:hypothetical protein D3C80_1220470 [compost metagenome]
MESHRIGGHHLGHLLVRIVDQQPLDRQHPLQHAVVVDHEQLVGMPRQLLESTQVAQHHLEADIVADGDHLEVHQRTDLVLLVGQRRAHPLALLGIEGLHQLVDHVARQFRRQVGQLVGVEVAGGGENLVIVHVGDQGFAHRIGDFEEDVAVALGLDQLPDGQTVVERQGFENMGDVGGVEVIKLALQLGQILAVHQTLHQLLVVAFLTLGQLLDQLVPVQQLDHQRQALLQAFLGLLNFGFGHDGALPVPLRRDAHRGRSIFQHADEQSRFAMTTG